MQEKLEKVVFALANGDFTIIVVSKAFQSPDRFMIATKS